MNRRLFLILLGLVLALPSRSQELPVSRPEAVGMSSERLDRLSGVLEHYVEEGRLPGGHALVVRRGQVVFDQAFGSLDLESNTPMPDDAIYRIASQSKAIVSVGVMMLQEEGGLLIGDPVGKYLPEFMETTVAVPTDEGGYEVVPAERRITIRDLLTHTAGIGYGGGPGAAEWEVAGIQGWYFGHMDEPIRETVRRMAALPMDAQPGARWVYGYNTDILGALVEVVSGQALDTFVAERILDPLGMRDTHFYLPESKSHRLATVYSVGENGLERAPAISAMVGQGAYIQGPRQSFSAGAGLLSTARDYARFLQMLAGGGVLNGTRLLSPKTVELMTSDHLRDINSPWGAGGGFGLGFLVTKDIGFRGQPGSPGSFEWGGAYHSRYWVDPAEDLVVVYFTQVIPASGLDDHGKIQTLIYQAIVE
jgi:CubicO group peptidase (beta-lactamase class C family)